MFDEKHFPQDVEREPQADLLLRFVERAEEIHAFNGKKFSEVFRNETTKREFLDGLSSEEFIELLNGTNGILRDKPKDEWIMDGENVELAGFIEEILPPRPEDKEDLIRETLQAVKRMNKNDRSLKDIALLASASINAIHPYLDANGRESRLLYVLLTENYGPELQKKMKIILDEKGRDEIDINPGFIGAEIDTLIEEELGLKNSEINKQNIRGLWSEDPRIHRGWDQLSFPDQIKTDDANLFKHLIQKDERFVFYSIFKYGNDHPDYTQEYLKVFPERSNILVDKMCQDMEPEQFQEIMNNYREFKKDHVQKLVDCIENPEKEEYRVEGQEGMTTLKDLFEERIEEEKERQQD